MIRICGHSVQDLTHADFFEIRKTLAQLVGLEFEQMLGCGGFQKWEGNGNTDPLVVFIGRKDSEVTMLLPSEAMFSGYRIRGVIDQIPSENPLKHTISLIAENLITSGISDMRVFFEPRFTPG